MENREKLMHDIAEGKETFDEAKFKKYFGLPDDWDWDDLANVSTREIENAIWLCNSLDINEI